MPYYLRFFYIALLALAGCVPMEKGHDIDPELLSHHNGFWVAEVQPDGFSKNVTIINDTHVNLDANRVTVYAQARIDGEVISPAQLSPGECKTVDNDQADCFHPNAVYLDGSGQELNSDNGNGQWWIKHSWVVNGEGYINCQMNLEPQDTHLCIPVAGIMLEDSHTMKIGGTNWFTKNVFNTRKPLLKKTPIRYQVTRYAPSFTNPTPSPQTTLLFDCRKELSGFNHVVRPCPVGDRSHPN
ncbi:MAG: hypothetical protein AAGF06_03380 [Pseudomonadota bacterium]